MKIKLCLFFLCLAAFAPRASAQTNEARKLEEFSLIHCGDILRQAGNAGRILQEQPEAKIYFIYYEGKYYRSYKTTSKGLEQINSNPVRGAALNRTKAIPLVMTRYLRVPRERIVLIDGGYRGQYEVEIWIVPNGAAPPQPTPTLTRKDIKFKRGKPYKTPDCERYYDRL
jgi:hypothetical protein